MFPGKMADSRSETENVQGEPGTSYVRKQRKCAENGKYRSKGKAASMKGQIWDNLGILKIEKKKNQIGF